MKILVTGADGFTGVHFVRLARACGHQPVGLKAKLQDRDALHHEVAECAPQAVVHLAAISSAATEYSLSFYDVNVIGTVNLLDALSAMAIAPTRILLASSANVYGNCGPQPIAETQTPSPVDHYGASKLAMELMAANYLARLPLSFVRPFNYTGVGQGDRFVIPKLVKLFARRAAVLEMGNLDVVREFNDVRHVCATYMKLLATALPGQVYNLCGGNAVTLRSVLGVLSQMTGFEPLVKVDPSLVRSSDISCLRGDPARLVGTVGMIAAPTLRETLQWMLDSAEQGAN